MVLCHTRELAFQIKKEFDRFSKHMGDKVKCEVMYGGQPMNDHIKILKSNPPTVIVGTPGRILALVKASHLQT
jgi:ATP-dependent RNA helicase UAP56/SUB2